MTRPQIPRPSHAINGGGLVDRVWFDWFRQLAALQTASDGGVAGLASEISAIATKLGSPDGTVANIPPLDDSQIRILAGAGIEVTGDADNGYQISLASNPAAMPCLQFIPDTSSTADSDPGAGLVKWDNATQSSATKLFFDDATSDTGTDLSAYFTELAASSTTGLLHMVADDGSFKLYKFTSIADGTGYFKFTVSHLVSSGGNFADGITVRVVFHPMPAGGGGGGGGAVTLLGTSTVSGAAASQLTISGLSLSSYKSFLVTFALKNATGSSSNISLYYNGDNTAANYAAEGVTYNSNAVSASRVSSGIVDALPGSETLTGEFRVQNDFDGRPRARYFGNRDSAASITMRHAVHRWATASNVTSITLYSSVANALAVGSTISVYGLS